MSFASKLYSYILCLTGIRERERGKRQYIQYTLDSIFGTIESNFQLWWYTKGYVSRSTLRLCEKTLIQSYCMQKIHKM